MIGTRTFYYGKKGRFGWFGHVQAPIDAAAIGPTTNCTLSQLFPNSLRHLQVFQHGRTLFMLNLECDFGPHLAMDPHPYWTYELTQLAIHHEPGEEGQRTGSGQAQVNPFPLPDPEEMAVRLREFGRTER